MLLLLLLAASAGHGGQNDDSAAGAAGCGPGAALATIAAVCWTSVALIAHSAPHPACNGGKVPTSACACTNTRWYDSFGVQVACFRLLHYLYIVKASCTKQCYGRARPAAGDTAPSILDGCQQMCCTQFDSTVLSPGGIVGAGLAPAPSTVPQSRGQRCGLTLGHLCCVPPHCNGRVVGLQSHKGEPFSSLASATTADVWHAHGASCSWSCGGGRRGGASLLAAWCAATWGPTHARQGPPPLASGQPPMVRPRIERGAASMRAGTVRGAASGVSRAGWCVMAGVAWQCGGAEVASMQVLRRGGCMHVLRFGGCTNKCALVR
jgi:hypothetical protein